MDIYSTADTLVVMWDGDVVSSSQEDPNIREFTSKYDGVRYWIGNFKERRIGSNNCTFIFSICKD